MAGYKLIETNDGRELLACDGCNVYVNKETPESTECNCDEAENEDAGETMKEKDTGYEYQTTKKRGRKCIEKNEKEYLKFKTTGSHYGYAKASETEPEKNEDYSTNLRFTGPVYVKKGERVELWNSISPTENKDVSKDDVPEIVQEEMGIAGPSDEEKFREKLELILSVDVHVEVDKEVSSWISEDDITVPGLMRLKSNGFKFHIEQNECGENGYRITLQSESR